MVYVSKFVNADGKEIIVSNAITEDKFAAIRSAITHVRQFLNETDHYITVLKDAEDFLSFVNGKSFKEEDTKFIQMNRYFSNYLNAFYTWKCFHHHQNSWYLKDQFEEICFSYQKKSMVYGIANQLRNYSTHNGFAINKLIFDVIAEKMYYMVAPQFFESVLGKSSKASRKLKQYLGNIWSAGLDARQFTLEFIAMFKEFQAKIWERAATKIQEEITFLLNFVPSNPPDCYNTYIIDTCNEKVYLDIGRILLLYTRRIHLLKEFK